MSSWADYDDDITYDEVYGAEEEEEEDIDYNEEDFSSEVLQMHDSSHTVDLIVVDPRDRKTTHWLTKFEVTEIINIRSTQISLYANCLVDISGLSDPVAMAWKELYLRKTPLIIRRILGEKKCTDGVLRSFVELWSPSEMTIPRVLKPSTINF
jgi:DNA-directed RNA polymerase I, II, and III subunit RPABC2